MLFMITTKINHSYNSDMAKQGRRWECSACRETLLSGEDRI